MFEEWYSTEFDVPAHGLDNAYNATLQQEAVNAPRPESIFGGSNQEDDD